MRKTVKYTNSLNSIGNHHHDDEEMKEGRNHMEMRWDRDEKEQSNADY